MITNNELLISNKSYTNLDFPAVYSELLDLCAKLTNRWNPDSSNESDPGVVLLKLLAFIADKTAYNIDKNVLECFITSATQEESMRNLCEMNGYSMKYYQSATTQISFSYNGELTSPFILPRFSTVVTTADKAVAYTLINNVSITESNTYAFADAIEGTINDLYVGDSTSIQLANLDDQYRIYFPDLMIAENGIFVIQGNVDWVKVDNLHTQELNSKVFKFGFDSKKELPYIEFPTDIANLIESGLNIKYISTSGAEGNISAKALTVLSSPDSIEGRDDLDLANNLYITNASSASNGRDKETIDEAYNSYKKVVGTFNTLVTARDYANFIYNLEINSKPIISNVHVADRRTDFNYSNNIITYEQGKGIHSVANVGAAEKDITAFDLCIYPFEYVEKLDSSLNYDKTFNVSSEDPTYWSDFIEAKCISHDVKKLDASSDIFAFKNYYKLTVRIDTSNKADYGEDIVANVKRALYKNFNSRQLEFGEEIPVQSIEEVIAKADSRISRVSVEPPVLTTVALMPNNTEIELTSEAAASIVNTIAAKNILSGAISLFDINNTIPLEYNQKEPAISAVQGNEYSPYVFNKLVSAATLTKIPYAKLSAVDEIGNKGYTLRDNEVIQFISPNLVTSKEFGIYVNYRLELADEAVTVIPANTVYKLKPGDILYIVYTDSDTNVEHKIKYEYNQITDNGLVTGKTHVIIQPTFDLTEYSASVYTTKVIKSISFDGESTLDFWSLQANESICQKEFVTTTLDNLTLPCYWITNNSSNILFDANDLVEDPVTHLGSITKLLDNGEYFIYSNNELTELVILGSGTRLTLTNLHDTKETFSSWHIDSDNILDIEDINAQGLAAFSGVNWQNKHLAQTPILVEEMMIKSFTAGDRVAIELKSGSSEQPFDALNNDFRLLNNYDITAKLNDGSDTVVSLNDLNIGGYGWSGRSRLDLNAGYSKQQAFLDGQELWLVDKTYEGDQAIGAYRLAGSDTDPLYVNFNYNVQFYGGGVAVENSGTASEQHKLVRPINIASRVINGLVITVNDGLTATVYNLYKVTWATTSGVVYPSVGKQTEYSGLPVRYDSENMLPLNLSGFGASILPDGASLSDDYGIKLSLLPMNKTRLFMVYIKADVDAGITIKADNGIIRKFNTKDETTEVEIGSGMHILELPAPEFDSEGRPRTQATKLLTINHSKDSKDILYVGKLNLIEGINNKLIRNAYDYISEEGLLNKIHQLAMIDGEDRFYYLNQVSPDRRINVNEDDIILAPSVFWDKNNIANQCTIGQIDFGNSVENQLARQGSVFIVNGVVIK